MPRTAASIDSGGSNGRQPPSNPFRFLVEMVSGTIFITMIALGVIKKNMCPIEPFIPTCLTLTGCGCLLLIMVDKIKLCVDPDRLYVRIVDPLLRFILGAEVLVCLITLTVFVTRSGGARGHCDKMLYVFSIFVIIFIAVESIVALAVFVLCNKARNKSRYREAADNA